MRALAGLLFLLLSCQPQIRSRRVLGPDGKEQAPAGQRVSAASEGQEEPADRGESALTEEMVAPYFPGDVAQALRLENWDRLRSAVAALEGGVDGSGDAGRRARIALLEGVSSEKLGDFARAAAAYERALPGLSILSDYLRYRAATSHLASGNSGAVLEHTGRIENRDAYAAGIAVLEGDAHGGRGELGKAEAVYRRYLAAGHRARRAEIQFRLAELLDRRGAPRAERVAQYRLVTIHWPVSAWAVQAEKRIAALLRRAPKSERRKVRTLSGEEWLAKAKGYFAAHRNVDSAAAFEAALASGQLDPRRTCYATYHQGQSWWKERNRTRAAPIFDRAIELCRAAGFLDLEAKAIFQAGRSYDRVDDAATAIARFEALEQRFPEHSYADDARLAIAEQHEEEGEIDRMSAVLASIPERYPRGDMRGVAVWRLARLALANKEYDRAIQWLEKRLELVPRETDWRFEGLAEYWLGRAHGARSRPKQAIAAYRRAIFDYPLSYYALLALNRIRESDPQEFERVAAEISAPPKQPGAGALWFGDRPFYHTDEFRRGIEFLRLGLGDEARRSFQRAGLRVPGGKSAVGGKEDADRLWALVFLFDAAGRYDKSHWVARWHVVDYKRHWPVGAWRRRWRMAYPLAFWELVSEEANKHGYPPELLLSFIREESGFSPTLESWANAIGLTQMIMPTARRFARGTGIRVTREALRDPQNNVTIGARFLDFLVKRYGGQFALAVPAYNAGESRLDRWHAEFGDGPQDLFAESIPGDQARGYAKRVIATYFAYSYLGSGVIPTIPLELHPYERD